MKFAAIAWACPVMRRLVTDGSTHETLAMLWAFAITRLVASGAIWLLGFQIAPCSFLGGLAYRQLSSQKAVVVVTAHRL